MTDALVKELRELSRSRGVHVPAIDRHVGPELRGVCGVEAGDGAAAVREKVVAWAVLAAQDLPEDMRVAALVALAVHERARDPFLRERINWLADEYRIGERTARRRVEQALTRLAEVGEIAAPAPVATPGEHAPPWWFSRFKAVLRLDGPTPVCTEDRTVVSGVDGLEAITWSISLPPATPGGPPGTLDVQVVNGVERIAQEQPSARRHLLHLRLPRPLDLGEEHDFSLQVSLPRGQEMQPSYVFWPERPCADFRLTVRFGQERPPERVWRVDGAYHRDADDPAPEPDLIEVDSIGEVKYAASGLRPDRGYGLQWRLP
ncbi:hypothetical protein [Actinosynnema sp.]|uniref:hypothetical protein n=1 Tax=Actinosynnema sp. TaxID=1872144 RepID=UPI003F8758CC